MKEGRATRMLFLNALLGIVALLIAPATSLIAQTSPAAGGAVGTAAAAPSPAPADTAVGQIRTELHYQKNRSLAPNRALLFYRDGAHAAGRIEGFDDRTLFIEEESGAIRPVGRAQLRRAIIETGRLDGSGLPFGLLFGIYLGHMLSSTAQGQPTAFLKDNVGSMGAATTFLYGLAGAGIAEWVNRLTSPSHEEHEITLGNPADPPEEEGAARLQGYLRETFSPRKFHFAMHGGKIVPGPTGRMADMLQEHELGQPGGAGIDWSAGRGLNLLREVALSYSVRENIEAGAAMLFLSEPSRLYSKTIATGNSEFLLLTARHEAKGYYATGTYDAFTAFFPRRVHWRIGAGIGMAHVDFLLNDTRTILVGYSSTSSSQQHAINFSAASALVFTTVEYSFNDLMSVGLSIDHAFLPSRHLEEIPGWNIPAQEISFSNSSVGLSFGLHLF